MGGEPFNRNTHVTTGGRIRLIKHALDRTAHGEVNTRHAFAGRRTKL